MKRQPIPSTKQFKISAEGPERVGEGSTNLHGRQDTKWVTGLDLRTLRNTDFNDDTSLAEMNSLEQCRKKAKAASSLPWAIQRFLGRWWPSLESHVR